MVSKTGPTVPGSRIYVLRTDEGEGIFGHDRDLATPFRDRPSSLIIERLRRAAHIKPEPRPEPGPRPKRRRPRRLYVPMDEPGSSVQQTIFDRATGEVLARLWASHFWAWQEAIRMAKSQGLTDRDVFVRQEA